MKEPKLFVATKALINYQEKILIVRESNLYLDGTNAGFFDVVGGRLEPGESFDAGLKREIREETGIDVRMAMPFFVQEWRPLIKGEQCQIVGIFFECFSDSDRVALGKDHSEYKWIDPRHFQKENLIPSLHPVFESYLKHRS